MEKEPVRRARVHPKRKRPFSRLLLALLGVFVCASLSYAGMTGLRYLPEDLQRVTDQLFPSQAQNAPVDAVMTAPTAIAGLQTSGTPTPAITPSPRPSPSPSPTPDPRSGLPILVNRTHPVDAQYKPQNLVRLADACPAEIVKIESPDTWADRDATQALVSMLRAGIDDGLANWQISAGYRSIAHQQRLLDEEVERLMKENKLSREDALSAAGLTVAPPGASEHHTGLAFDINVPGKLFVDTPQAKWLEAHCHEYGFVLRYQKHKEDITGYLAEAWHFRYVGNEIAQSMTTRDWCLEEYIEHTAAR